MKSGFEGSMRLVLRVYRTSAWSPATMAPPAAFASGTFNETARYVGVDPEGCDPGGRTAMCTPSLPATAIFVASSGSFAGRLTVVTWPTPSATACNAFLGAAPRGSRTIFRSPGTSAVRGTRARDATRPSTVVPSGGGPARAVAANGLDALKAIETEGVPDLVLTDVSMPLLNGLELIKRLRQNQRTSRTPIVIVSEQRSQEDALAAYAQGADDYLAKPIDVAILVAKIETILRQISPGLELITAPPALLRGTVIVFVHGKGGVGTTTLAVNVAAARNGEGASTLLIDLNLQFGNAAMFLDLQPRYTVADLARLGTASVTDDLFAEFLTDHQSGLQILAAPLSPEEGARGGCEMIQQAIDLARNHRHAVLIDLPSTLDEATMAAIDTADVVCVVTAPHLAALRATADLLATLSRIGKSKERTIVACDRI